MKRFSGPNETVTGQWISLPKLISALSFVLFGILFVLLFQIPEHAVLDTGGPSRPVGPITRDVAYAQRIMSGQPLRVSALEVLLATWGKPTNATHDVVRVLDGSGVEVGRREFPPGALVDNAYTRIDLLAPQTLRARDSLYVVVASHDGTRAQSITALATASPGLDRLVRLEGENAGRASPIAALSSGRRVPGSLCIRLYGVGRRALLVEQGAKIVVMALCIALAAAVVFFTRPNRRLSGTRARAKSAFEQARSMAAATRIPSLGRRLTEVHLIRFDAKVQVLCAAAMVLFCILVPLKVHYSSLEVWNAVLPSDVPGRTDSALLAGRPKSIRSDEWGVDTPQVLHDYRSPTHLSAGRRALDVASPWNWGFYLLGVERGFAFLWNFWLFGSVLGLFFLMMLVTRNNFSVSLFSSVFMLLSSYSRWWGTTVYVATLSIVAVSLVIFLLSRRRLNICLSFVALCVFGAHFVLLLYPAWQVTLGYLMVFVVVGLLMRRGARHDLWSHGRLKLVLAGVGVIGGAMAAAAGYLVSAATIAAEMATVYPGRRVSTGGDLGLLYLFSGYLDGFFTELRSFAANICESSGFILLYPFAILGLLVERAFTKRRSVSPVMIALVVYLCALSFYVLIGVPPLISRLILLSYVPAARALFGIGFASILLIGAYISRPPSEAVPNWARATLIPIAFGALLVFSWYFGRGFGFPAFKLTIVTCAALVIAVGAMLYRAKALFFGVMLLLVAVPSLQAMPISSGLAPVYGKRLVQRVEQVVQANPRARWLVYGDRWIPQIVRAAGADTFNGVTFPPQATTMRELAPGVGNEQVWNRFAHIQCEPAPPGVVDLTLNALDWYTLRVNPTDPRLAGAGVRIFVAPQGMEQYFSSPQFRELTTEPLNGYVIYMKTTR